MTEWIQVSGARTHNLRNITVRIPRGRIVAFTGVSGSGKTSLAIDTIHAEAQLRYLEGLSPFVRQYITPRDRPQVDRIDGLGATLAVDQRKLNRSSRSTVGTMTGIDAYLGLLYSRLATIDGETDVAASHFSKHSPEGGCPECHGAGGSLHADADLIVTNPDLPLLDGASPWFAKLRSTEQTALPFLAERQGVDLSLPWRELPETFRDSVLYGTGDEPIAISIKVPNKNSNAEWIYQNNKPMLGAIAEVERLFGAAGTENAKQRYVPFMRQAPCRSCDGSGFGTAARTVTLNGMSYRDLVSVPVGRLAPWSQELERHLTGVRREIGEVLLPELRQRADLLERLGLGHLELERPAPSMSGGELQRARTAAQLSTALSGIVFVLDELSSGLHPEDKQNLAPILHGLRDAGNTVLMVEHDPDVIALADWVIDLGPSAGRHGGQVMFAGTPADLRAHPQSPTGRYLTSDTPRVQRASGRPLERSGTLVLHDVNANNVRADRIEIPLGVLTCVTGVSGSGKSSLLHLALAPAVTEALAAEHHDSVREITGLEPIRWVEVVDQSPIGRTPRSNPATYTKAFDSIRQLFASTPQAAGTGLDATAFSFNAAGGRCEACTGYGKRLVDMHFLPDVWATCDVCQGRRFTDAVLGVTYLGMAIDEVLHLTVDEAAQRFEEPQSLAETLRALQKVGLGYLELGQSATDLSGGEAQRLKLANALRRTNRGRKPGLVLLDEPLTGLHPSDVQRMVATFDDLLQRGNTVVVAEHDLHLAACADWLIDMGPGAGDRGGLVMAAGAPQDVSTADSVTAGYLRKLLA
ncbi:excinuclease ABC subunit A [Kibdelosporangium banguiense]|uniref:UvrABC system protein A n=1 Tax=Kibdelosporangium banguiense TaxID=1365924 RepID=A0ABS4TYE7_9PSEU|nr:excinuclease ABC subunit UvrA [Kibdelosporangium banguiense]MBP2329391.1 excinuclease ABC subunit A [Kibdelosporangium banguiense]